jgi:hypothetical protein
MGNDPAPDKSPDDDPATPHEHAVHVRASVSAAPDVEVEQRLGRVPGYRLAATERRGGDVSLSYYLTRVWIDDPWLADDLGLDPEGHRMIYTVDDAEMDSAALTAWLSEAADLKEHDLDWIEGSGLNISGQEYAQLDVGDERDAALHADDEPDPRP